MITGRVGAGAGAGAPATSAGATPANAADDKRLRKACADFEAVFMSQIFQQMRQTVPHDGLLDGGAGEDMFTSMMDEHVAGSAAARMQNGVGAALYRQLRTLLRPEGT